MKRIILIFTFVIGVASCFAAGGVMVVDSEKVFMSQADYVAALAEVDSLSKSYQAQVDEKFAKVETLFNDYTAQRASLSTSQRSDREALILIQEKLATEFQQSHFSTDGTIMRRRLELIAPIQERVFGVIESYAEECEFDVVLDKSSNNSTLLYYSKGADRTDEIIEKLK